MKFIVNGVKYELDQEKVTFGEARAIQKAVGKTMGELRETPGDITGDQALIWIAMRREDPTLKFSDLDDMPLGDIEPIEDDEAGEEEPADPQVLGAEPEPTEDSTPSE